MRVVSFLFSPFSLRGVAFANRAWVSPMCQYSADRGVVGQWHQVHLGSFATGGAGLVMAEATAVVPEGRISVACPGLWNEQQVDAWRVITDFAHSQHTKIGVQLAHAGRKASTLAPWSDHHIASEQEGGWTAVAPSAVAFADYPIPHELSLDQIDELVDAFGEAARRAIRAGFDVLEIHAAHGYLIHQFLSPLSNHRSDEYGGSFENRTRFALRIASAVRGVIDDAVPLLCRISATDYTQGGWDLEDSIQLSALLRDAGVDLIDVSSGGNVAGAVIPFAPGYQVAFAEAIRAKAGVPTSSVGLITEPVHANDIIATGRSDAVMMAREFLRNPRWALYAAERLGDVIEWPVQFDRARTLRN
ncbi:MAG TPA: NADH:flavin oxidoreductase/NADH oxidase [Acidimicrobiales bacterium]|nr:NADH:flavin oxidoreductase/NADH oxidase [Acidimicrobiales bacterium]